MTDSLRAEIEALAEQWRYKGEFGWDDGSHAYGPDEEGFVLDRASAELRAILDRTAPSEDEPEALARDLSSFLFSVYDHGTAPNAKGEADAILAFLASKGFRRIDPTDEALVKRCARMLAQHRIVGIVFPPAKCACGEKMGEYRADWNAWEEHVASLILAEVARG